MRVSNAMGQNWGQSRTSAASKTEGKRFFDILKKEDWNSQVEFVGTHYDLSTRFPYASFPMHIDDLTNPLKLDLSKLSAAKRAELNQKYQLDSMKPDSEEYHAFIKELQKEGILSAGKAYTLPPNVIGIRTDRNGNVSAITMMLCGNDTDGTILDYTRNLMQVTSEQYEMLKAKASLTKAEQALVSIYESHQSILDAMEEIFSEQLLKK